MRRVQRGEVAGASAPVLVSVALTVAVADAGGEATLTALVGGLGVVAVVAGIVRRAQTTALVGTVLLGAAYLIAAFVGKGHLPGWAAVPCGVGCFLVAELACELADAPRHGIVARPFVGRARRAHLALVVGATVAVGIVALVVDDHPHGGALLELGGLVVASTLVLVVAAVSRRRGGAERAPG
jgi:hypothetical protein